MAHVYTHYDKFYQRDGKQLKTIVKVTVKAKRNLRKKCW